MKKINLLFPFLLVTCLLASSSFWQTFIDIQNELYAHKIVESKVSEPIKDSNITKNETKMQTSEEDVTKLIDKRVQKFNELIALIKEKPYEVKSRNNPYYNSSEVDSIRAKLKTRITVNSKYGYKVAVTRDKIALATLQTKEHIYNFFVNLAENWTKLDAKAIESIIKKERDWLKTIDISTFKKFYELSKNDNNQISQQIVSNYLELRVQVDFYQDFLDYLLSNPTLLKYRSLTAILNLNSMIDNINSISSFAKINTTLRYIHLDMGRLVLFVLIMLLAWSASYLIYYRIYAFLKKQIIKKEDAVDDLLLANLNGIRRPFLILVIAFGFELGLEVLLYPSALPEKLILFLYALYLGIIVYILLILVDSIFTEYLFKKDELKNRHLRQELVNLILSIVKVTIVIIAGFMLLVRMGVNITGLLASLGIGGLAVALAAQNTLSNFFGLLKIIFDNSFSQGDWIETKDVEGTVVEIGFISTMIRTFDNALITVPNANLANSYIKNWSKRSVGRRIKMHIGVSYGASRESVMKAIDEIAAMLESHPGIATPKRVDKKVIVKSKREKKLVSIEDKYGIKTTLLVYLDEFADSSINILIYTFSKTVVWKEWLEIKQDVLLKIWEILERNNLEFAFPSQSIYFDPENLEKSFKAISGKPKD
ncbi:mechanosensitive ion channel family protein [Hydrogenimonas thermophila]|uniref:mechanosensitive ion channel family protein n=1 Tax=Hydrogenimonas thermophila TaxID=223786 RepID=UPI002936E436|nr:mechanosensitive ion channel family protein [Hydrogenimonas thermophila]WOE69215.1 mechanosensitive ion channel family protein [Hydrogenimonas thermophila]WOE71725.1 mechanosensitive ion channel family protein [Hydrogenimonas thermophila]